MPAASADLTTLAADLMAAGDDAQRLAANLVQTTAVRVQELAKVKAPRDTGELAGSIGIRYESQLAAVIGPRVHYGVYQEFGTGSRGEFAGQAYKIRPKTPGGRLVFQVQGRTVYAKEVTHPGVRAQPFMRPAMTEALGPMSERLAEIGALVITKGPRSAL